MASGHLGHDDPHPGDPLVPPEVPIWFRPGVGGLGILLAFVAARASAGGRVSDWIAAAGVVLGVALLLVALAARPGWF